MLNCELTKATTKMCLQLPHFAEQTEGTACTPTGQWPCPFTSESSALTDAQWDLAEVGYKLIQTMYCIEGQVLQILLTCRESVCVATPYT